MLEKRQVPEEIEERKIFISPLPSALRSLQGLDTSPTVTDRQRSPVVVQRKDGLEKSREDF